MQTLLLTILVLGLLVFVHELGHFVTAKWAGIAVPRFSLGLGPRVVGVKVGETDYCISAIPFGGYVKMAGMEGEEAFEGLEGGPEEIDPESDVPSEQRFDSKSLAWRLLVISAGVLMNFALGWVIYVGIAWHEGIPTVPGTAVAEVDSTVAAAFPALVELPEGAEIEAVDGVAVSNWHEIDRAILEGEGDLELTLASGEAIRLQTRQPDRERISAGLAPLVPPVVSQVEPESPAAAAGFRESDRIVSVDGRETTSFSSVSELIRSRPDQLVPVVVERSGPDGVRQLTLTVRTGSTRAPRPEDGRFVDTGWLGVGAAVGQIDLGPVEAFTSGTGATLRAGTLILDGLYQLVTGGVSLRSLGGPVAIGQLTGHFARQGTSALLSWVALFSINLAILNLLPIPVLDGGHLLFLGIEGTRGRPLSARQKMRMSQVGLAFLGLLMAWAFTADILRLVGL